MGFEKFSSPFENGIRGICSDPHNTGYSPGCARLAFTLLYAFDATYPPLVRICDSRDFRIADRTPYLPHPPSAHHPAFRLTERTVFPREGNGGGGGGG